MIMCLHARIFRVNTCSVNTLSVISKIKIGIIVGCVQSSSAATGRSATKGFVDRTSNANPTDTPLLGKHMVTSFLNDF